MSIIFVTIEAVGSYSVGSIAILSDAAHIASDAIGFSISILALHISHTRANSKYTFGYHRVEVLGALCSIFAVWAMTAFLVCKAWPRLFDPHDVGGRGMLWIAFASLIFNLIMIKVLHSGEGGHAHPGGGSCPGHHHADPAHSSHEDYRYSDIDPLL